MFNIRKSLDSYANLATHSAGRQRLFMLLACACFAMFGGGLYIQHGLGVEPCPMCIVQRYALLLTAGAATFAGLCAQKRLQLCGAALSAVFAGLGAVVAAKQSLLQWNPPEVATCGRDLYGMLESFPLKRVIPMLFKGSGDCSKTDWTFLGGSLANWSFVCFVSIAILLAWLLTAASRPSALRTHLTRGTGARAENLGSPE